jgi:hypothetical protein
VFLWFTGCGAMGGVGGNAWAAAGTRVIGRDRSEGVPWL